MSQLILVVSIVVLSGFVHGLSGFGFGLVAMALLPLVMNLKDAVALVVMLNAIVVVITFWRVRAHYAWRQGWVLLLGTCVGVPLGVFLLVRLDELLLRHLLGAVMCLLVVFEFIASRKSAFRMPNYLEFPIGAAGGGMSGAFNMGGPLVVAYTYSQPWSKEQVVALLQVVFGLSTVLRLALLGTAGLLQPHLIAMSAWSVVPMVATLALGGHYCSRISQAHLKRGAYLFLGLVGFKYLLAG